MWWYKHLPIIVLQIIAFIPYILGSHRFYKRKSGFMHWLAIGIVIDILMTLSPFIFDLPRMEGHHGAPWSSVLFILHIATAGTGMFGFIIMFFYLLAKGTKRNYYRLRRFQYMILLRLWIFGVSIALTNFFIKVLYEIRIYDYI